MSSIHINYNSLRDDPKNGVIDDELLKKAKGLLGWGARKELIRLFDSQLRVLASEVAQRQMNPQLLYEAGEKGIMSALELYNVGHTRESFRTFAMPLIRQQMMHARSKHAPPA